MWADRQGKIQPVTDEIQGYGDPRISPDGSRLAVRIRKSVDSSIWALDLDRGTWSRLTHDSTDEYPIWSPDGSHLAYASSRTGGYDLHRIPSDGSGQPELLRDSIGWDFPTSWSADGRHIAFVSQDPERSYDVWVLDLETDSSSEPLIATKFRETRPRFSPDGRYLAFLSNKTGSTQA